MSPLEHKLHEGRDFFFSFWPRCSACGILVPQPGIEPVPPAVEAQSLNHWTSREVPRQGFLSVLFTVVSSVPRKGSLHFCRMKQGILSPHQPQKADDAFTIPVLRMKKLRPRSQASKWQSQNLKPHFKFCAPCKMAFYSGLSYYT